MLFPSLVPKLDDLAVYFRASSSSLGCYSRWHGIYFEFASDLASSGGTHADGSQQWAALLYVYACDVSRLMREEFDCTAAGNVAPGRGYVVRDCNWQVTPQVRLPGNRFAVRHYALTDQPDDERPRSWVAAPFVGASDERFDILARFRLADLYAGTVGKCEAFNAYGQLVYLYDHWSPETRFNCLHGEDMPLEELWPWPKKGAKKEAEEEEADTVGRMELGEQTVREKRTPVGVTMTV